jgi:hypothetical protein
MVDDSATKVVINSDTATFPYDFNFPAITADATAGKTHCSYTWSAAVADAAGTAVSNYGTGAYGTASVLLTTVPKWSLTHTAASNGYGIWTVTHTATSVAGNVVLTYKHNVSMTKNTCETTGTYAASGTPTAVSYVNGATAPAAENRITIAFSSSSAPPTECVTTKVITIPSQI